MQIVQTYQLPTHFLGGGGVNYQMQMVQTYQLPTNFWGGGDGGGKLPNANGPNLPTTNSFTGGIFVFVGGDDMESGRPFLRPAVKRSLVYIIAYFTFSVNTVDRFPKIMTLHYTNGDIDLIIYPQQYCFYNPLQHCNEMPLQTRNHSYTKEYLPLDSKEEMKAMKLVQCIPFPFALLKALHWNRQI